MPPQTIESRVEKLEEQVTSLRELPGRIDGLSVQISQVRADLGAQMSQLRKNVDALDVRLSASERTLREEIVAGDERILAQARVLHEEVISRLALIQEGQPRRRKRRSSPLAPSP